MHRARRALRRAGLRRRRRMRLLRGHPDRAAGPPRPTLSPAPSSDSSLRAHRGLAELAAHASRRAATAWRPRASARRWAAPSTPLAAGPARPAGAAATCPTTRTRTRRTSRIRTHRRARRPAPARQRRRPPSDAGRRGTPTGGRRGRRSRPCRRRRRPGSSSTCGSSRCSWVWRPWRRRCRSRRIRP